MGALYVYKKYLKKKYDFPKMLLNKYLQRHCLHSLYITLMKLYKLKV